MQDFASQHQNITGREANSNFDKSLEAITYYSLRYRAKKSHFTFRICFFIVFWLYIMLSGQFRSKSVYIGVKFIKRNSTDFTFGAHRFDAMFLLALYWNGISLSLLKIGTASGFRGVWPLQSDKNQSYLCILINFEQINYDRVQNNFLSLKMHGLSDVSPIFISRLQTKFAFQYIAGFYQATDDITNVQPSTTKYFM